ncbi:thiamine phosphate synthase [Nitrosospira sp. NpAV]|uniref:thiamine phosphate synthase n=1 Tax=Nitrosospira sp. NpAV TaxID=58133 RepID=UPI0005A02133|nr:thiamine phosphate synthase [Nitrosospira sp. NpAV]KIO50135.1 thiamine-phosphate synthase [Nitrosospira sp. NpAV]
MTRPQVGGLYAITPEIAGTPRLITMTREILRGGARLVQYRNKIADTSLQLEQASSLAHLCRKFGIPFIVNDHLDLAVEVDADGVHVGQDDASVSDARRRLGRGKIIGVSCYNRLELAVEAEREGADYVAFGAFFVSITKPGATVAPMDLLHHAKRKLHIPIVAIGGITPNNGLALIQQGADAVAASNALFDAPNIQLAAEKFSRLFDCTPVFHSS